jgi:hypothetical protein
MAHQALEAFIAQARLIRRLAPTDAAGADANQRNLEAAFTSSTLSVALIFPALACGSTGRRRFSGAQTRTQNDRA